jgi:hypothetical protein
LAVTDASPPARTNTTGRSSSSSLAAGRARRPVPGGVRDPRQIDSALRVLEQPRGGGIAAHAVELRQQQRDVLVDIAQIGRCGRSP